MEYSDESLLTSELKDLMNDKEFINLEESVRITELNDIRYLCIKFHPSMDWYMLRLSDYNYKQLKEYIEKTLTLP